MDLVGYRLGVSVTRPKTLEPQRFRIAFERLTAARDQLGGRLFQNCGAMSEIPSCATPVFTGAR